jgi:hypothetical protein
VGPQEPHDFRTLVLIFTFCRCRGEGRTAFFPGFFVIWVFLFQKVEKNFQKGLTKGARFDIIEKRLEERRRGRSGMKTPGSRMGP